MLLFTSSIPTDKSQKILSNVTENFRTPVWTWRNVIAGTKRAIPSEQFRFVFPTLVANDSAGFGSEARSDWLVKIRISFAIYLRATREKMASRFASVTSEEITQINDEAVPENTKKAISLVWMCLKVMVSFFNPEFIDKNQ